eukprot:8885003-Alexandrium_andersonii.AAC.1
MQLLAQPLCAVQSVLFPLGPFHRPVDCASHERRTHPGHHEAVQVRAARGCPSRSVREQG